MRIAEARRPLLQSPSSDRVMSTHSCSSEFRAGFFPARPYQYPAFDASPSLRCKYACTQAHASPSSCPAVSCPRAQSPLASHHNPASAALNSRGGASRRSDSRNPCKVIKSKFSGICNWSLKPVLTGLLLLVLVLHQQRLNLSQQILRADRFHQQRLPSIVLPVQ